MTSFADCTPTKGEDGYSWNDLSSIDGSCTPTPEQKAKALNDSDLPADFKKGVMSDLLNDPTTSESLKEQALTFKKQTYIDEYLTACWTKPSDSTCTPVDRQRVEGERSVSLSKLGISPSPGATSFETVIANFVRWLVRIIGVFAVFCIMIAGIFLTVSAGEEGTQARGKEILKAAIYALLAVLGAYVVVSTVLQVIYSLGK